MVDESLERRLATMAGQWYNRPPAPPESINQDLSFAILRLRLQNIIDYIRELTFLQRQAIDDQDAQGARQYTEMAETFSQQRRKLEQTRDALSLMGQRRAEASRFG
jgi:hypothetical protein